MDCNEGPGSTEWFAIDALHVPILRSKVSKLYEVDIFQNEGNWFPTAESLRDLEIPFMQGSILIYSGAYFYSHAFRIN